MRDEEIEEEEDAANEKKTNQCRRAGKTSFGFIVVFIVKLKERQRRQQKSTHTQQLKRKERSIKKSTEPLKHVFVVMCRIK